jgi:hydroxymethylbilane synthase
VFHVSNTRYNGRDAELQGLFMNKRSLVIATRESPLALWQANWVKSCLEQQHPGLAVQLLGMTTQADRMPYVSLEEVGGKGLFVKELEEALYDKRADIAVHSMKDMPVDLPPGLCLPAMSERADPHDALVSNQFATVAAIPLHAVIGTSSLRRQSQLLHWRPDLQVKPLRGNVNTRLAKLDSGEYAAIILAAAGLQRLGFHDRIRCVLPSERFLPAAAQGVLGIQCREADADVQQIIATLNHLPSYICATAERAVSRSLGANCQVPVAAFAEIQDGKLFLRGLVLNRDGSVVLRAERRGELREAENLGLHVGEDLLSQGAAAVLKSCEK